MPEPQAPEQPAPQPTPEVVQTPRQRVEASLEKRGETARKLNVLSSKRTRTPLSPEDFDNEQRLREQLDNQIKEFFTEIVNNEPEAEAWLRIEDERVGRELGNQSREAFSSTPEMEKISKQLLHIAWSSYGAAFNNLWEVRKRAAASVGATPK